MSINKKVKSLKMVIKWGDMAFIVGFCTIIILTTFIAGCTTSNSGTNNSVSTLAEPTSNPVQVVQPVNTGNPTEIQDQQKKGPVKLTINSAKKMINLGKASPKPGNIFLVLDITVKNRNVDQGYVLGNKSITLYDPEDHERVDLELNSHPEIQKELENPIIPDTKLKLNETITGQVLFEITDSTNYNLNLMGHYPEVLASQSINFDSLIKTPDPISLKINSAKTVSVLEKNTNTSPSAGHVFLVLNITIKNNGYPEGFTFTDRSITTRNSKTGYFVDFTLNSKPAIQKGLEEPIIGPITIKQNEAITGQILFGTTDSTDYRLNLLDNNNAIILSKNIHVE